MHGALRLKISRSAGAGERRASCRLLGVGRRLDRANSPLLTPAGALGSHAFLVDTHLEALRPPRQGRASLYLLAVGYAPALDSEFCAPYPGHETLGTSSGAGVVVATALVCPRPSPITDAPHRSMTIPSWVLGLIETMMHEIGGSVLLIIHDFWVAAQMTDGGAAMLRWGIVAVVNVVDHVS